MAAKNDNSLFRNIGQFVGHIAHAVKTDPTAPPTSEPVAVRTTIEEQVSPDGSLVLRRTTIDEIAVVDSRVQRADGTNTTERSVPDHPEA